MHAPSRLALRPASRAATAFAALLALAGPEAHAVVMLPSSEASPKGITHDMRPEFGGTVLADRIRTFSVPDGAGGFVRGHLQDRVYRSNETGTLVFSQRLVLDPGSSTVGKPSEWTRSGLTLVTTDVDYRLDGLGSIGAGSMQRLGSGGELRFKMSRTVSPGESTYFHEAMTNALRYDARGSVTIIGPGMPRVTLPAFRPVGAVQPNYTVTALAPTSRWAFLNDYGQVSLTLGDPVSGHQAALWQPARRNDIDGTVHTIPLAPGYLYSEAMRISEKGQLAGNSYMRPDSPEIHADPAQRAFRWVPRAANQPVGTTQDLGVLPGGSYSMASGINDRGEVVGGGDYAGAPIGADGRPYADPLLWAGGGVQRLGMPTSFGGGYSINQDGAVAGYGNFAAGTYEGYVWTPDVPGGTTGSHRTVFDVGGDAYRVPGTTGDINDLGVAVGNALIGWPAGDAAFHGYVWSSSGVHDLGENRSPAAINNHGVAVGTTEIVMGALFRNGVTTKLRYFSSPTQDWTLAWMFDVNLQEQIVGLGSTPTTPASAVLLTPVRLAGASPSPRDRSDTYTMTVTGMGFADGAVVRFNGAALSTTRVDSRTLHAVVPASMLGSPDEISVMVTNADGTQSTVKRF